MFTWSCTHRKVVGPPRERFWEFVGAVSLVCICLAVGLGTAYSAYFYQDTVVMAIRLQAAAQSFVFFACLISGFYLIAHASAALSGSRIYEDPRHRVTYHPPQTISEKWQPFVHILHAWARLLGLLSLIAWVSATIFIATLLVDRTKSVLVATSSSTDDDPEATATVPHDESALFYLRFDMVACALGVAGSLMMSMVLWCVKRPYGVCFFLALEDGVSKRVSVVSSCTSKRSSMSASDAGSVGSSIGGDTVVAVASAAATVVGDHADKEGEKSGGGTLKVDGEKQGLTMPPPPPPKMGPPGQWPSAPGGYPPQATYARSPSPYQTPYARSLSPYQTPYVHQDPYETSHVRQSYYKTVYPGGRAATIRSSRGGGGYRGDESGRPGGGTMYIVPNRGRKGWR